MAKLEYRLADEQGEFPLLFEYDRIGLGEAALRFACEFFVKERLVYEKVSSVAEDRDRYVIYVKKAPDEQAYETEPLKRPDWRGIRVEIRKFTEEAMLYPVLETLDFEDDREALLLLTSTHAVSGGKEWERTSAEIDEDRKRYVLYVQEVGNHE